MLKGLLKRMGRVEDWLHLISQSQTHDGEKRTCLMYAVRGGKREIVKFLMDLQESCRGPRDSIAVKEKDNKHRNALAYAVMYGQVSILETIFVQLKMNVVPRKKWRVQLDIDEPSIFGDLANEPECPLAWLAVKHEQLQAFEVYCIYFLISDTPPFFQLRFFCI